jgi:hypothetical protein
MQAMYRNYNAQIMVRRPSTVLRVAKRTVPGPPTFGSSGTDLRSWVSLGRPRLVSDSTRAMWSGTGPPQPLYTGTILGRQPLSEDCYLRVVLDELLEIIDQSEKRFHIVHILRNWPRLDRLNFLGIGTNALLIHDVTQVLNLCLSEAGLRFTNVKRLTFKHFENKPHMGLMLSFGFRENQDVTVGRVNTARLLDMCGNHG